jgi:hypothetical protein
MILEFRFFRERREELPLALLLRKLGGFLKFEIMYWLTRTGWVPIRAQLSSRLAKRMCMG